MEIWDDWFFLNHSFFVSSCYNMQLLELRALLFPTRDRGEIDLPFASKEALLVNRSFNIIRGLRKSRSFKLERKKQTN